MKRAILLLALAASAQAQLDHTFQIDPVASAFTWDGQTNLGPIVGVPDNNFNLSGTVVLELSPGTGQPIGEGRFHGGDVILPTIKGEIPGAFGIPLATIELVGVHFTTSSPLFPVDALGGFSGDLTLTATQGTLTYTPAIGNPTTIDLTGMASDPAPVTGTLSFAGGDIHLDLPISAQFPFSDPSTGISGTLTINGTLVADYDCPAPSTYCVLSPNSVGAGARMGSSGSTSLFTNDLVLEVSDCPANQFGLFFYGTSQVQLPVGDGNLCVGGGLVRLPVVQTDAMGQASFPLDVNALPGGDQFFPGDTRDFSFWYRDVPGGPAGFNFADGLEAYFCL